MVLSLHTSNAHDMADTDVCPITLEAPVDPVRTPCCTKVFSGEPLREALAMQPKCPMCRTGLAVSAISGQLIVVDARQGRRVKLRIRYKRSRGKDGWRLSNPVDCRWTADIVIGGMDCHAAWAICRRAEVPFRPLIFSVDGNGIVVPDDATLGELIARVRSAGKNVVHVWYRRCATGHTCHMSCSQEEADSPTACRASSGRCETSTTATAAVCFRRLGHRRWPRLFRYPHGRVARLYVSVLRVHE